MGAFALQNWAVVLAFALVLLVFAWMTTYGTWRFLEVEDFGNFFDAQAKSLLAGKFDVPMSAIRGEAFIVNGKYYGYFGVAPALWRIPLAYFFPQMEGCWARLSMLVACFLNLLFAYLFYRLIQRKFFAKTEKQPANQLVAAFFLLSVGLGTTNIFLASRSFVYHEASMWGGSWALISLYFLCRYILEPSYGNLIKVLVFSFFTFLTRATIGFGILLVCLLLATVLLGSWLGTNFQFLKNWAERISDALSVAIPKRPFPAAAIILSGITFIFCIFMGVNYARFGEFSTLPLSKHIQYIKSPERLQKVDQRAINLSNLRTTGCNYFSLSGISFSRHFPWIGLISDIRLFKESRIDFVEFYASIPTGMGSLFSLAVLGTIYTTVCRKARTKGMRLVFLGSLAAAFLTLAASAISYRYLHDFFPFLVIGSATGISLLISARQTKLMRLVVMTWILLAVLCIYANLTFAVSYQREFVWGVDQIRKQEFLELRYGVDTFLSWKPMQALHAQNIGQIVNPVRGQIWIEEEKVLHWFDGEGWIRVCESPEGSRLKLALGQEIKANEGAKKQRFQEIFNALYNFFAWEPLGIIYTQGIDSREKPSKGQIWLADWDHPSIFWFNGEQWIQVYGSPGRPLKILIAKNGILRIHNPNGLEGTPDKQFFWLENKETTIDLFAVEPGFIKLWAEVAPGPSLPGSSSRTVILKTDSGYFRTWVVSSGKLEITIPVKVGRNRLGLHVQERPMVFVLPSGDTRPVLLSVGELRTQRIEPRELLLPPIFKPEGIDPSKIKIWLGNGWYDSEITHIWGNDDPEIMLSAAFDGLEINVQANYKPLNQNNRVAIELNGKKIVNCSDNKQCTAKRIILRKGHNILKFKTRRPSSIPRENDHRPLSYAFTSVEISSRKVKQ